MINFMGERGKKTTPMSWKSPVVWVPMLALAVDSIAAIRGGLLASCIAAGSAAVIVVVSALTSRR